MYTNEWEYHVLSHLITMPERQLAQCIELLIWSNSATPNDDVINELCRMCELSEGPQHFTEMLKKYAEASGKVFTDSPMGMMVNNSKEGEMETIRLCIAWSVARLKEREEPHLNELAQTLEPIIAIL